MNKTSRHYGVDALRIVSILGVVLLHVLNHGGLLKSVQGFSASSIVWFLNVLAYPAVNCFVLISGYVGYRKNKCSPRLKNLISLLFIVLFYSISIALLFKVLSPSSIGLSALLSAFAPTITKQYWFFTAYVGMFLLSPILNLAVDAANKKQLFIFALVFALLSGLSLIRDSFSLLKGFSMIWFVLLYVIGAAIKKYDLTKAFSTKIWLILIVSAFLITWSSKIMLGFISIPFLHNQSNFLISYTSPTVVIMSIGWLCLFSGITCKSSLHASIRFFSSSAFSVYLIHDNLHIRKHLISKISELAQGYGPVMLPLLIIGSVAIIFLSCILIDKLRVLLFRLLRVDSLSQKLEHFIKGMINRLYRVAVS